MTLSEVNTLFVMLTKKYNIKGWRLMFEEMPKIRGCCDYDNKTISINPNILTHSRMSITATLLHEIAHLLTGNEREDHGIKWNDKLADLIADFSFVSV